MTTWVTSFKIWLPQICGALLFSCIVLCILRSEIYHRRQSSTQFTTELLKNSSISCMTLGFVYFLFQIIRYCFSNSQVHSKNGYPKYLFNIMYSLLILAGGSFFIQSAMHRGNINKNCGIDDSFNLRRETVFPNMHYGNLVYLTWSGINGAVLFSTDIITLDYLHLVRFL